MARKKYQINKKSAIATELAVIIIIFCMNVRLFAKQKEQDKSISATGPAVEIFNPHYTGKYCNECHEKTSSKGEDTFLKYDGDFGKLCLECHLKLNIYSI